MWKPGEVVESHRRRAVAVWIVSVVAIIAYSGYLLYKAAEKAKAPDTSFALTNVVYKFPNLWICPYENYGCDLWEIEQECTQSAWWTEGGEPDAVFYPREKFGQPSQVATEELPIGAVAVNTTQLYGKGRGHCVVFETSAATAFVGQERDPDEYLDYIYLDMYWYPGGESKTSTTCVPEGQEWDDHREWVYGFLSDPDDPTMTSTGIQLSYSCITNTSNTHVFNTMVIGLTSQNKYMSEDVTSYKALTNWGVHKDKVNPNITMPYARLSLDMKQQFDSWEIITESSPFEFAEMFGNIGGFWDLLLILWPLCFVATTQQDPHLKARTFKKSVIRGAERATGITRVIARSVPTRGSETKSSSSATVDGLDEEPPPWEQDQAHRRQIWWQGSRRWRSLPPRTAKYEMVPHLSTDGKK